MKIFSLTKKVKMINIYCIICGKHWKFKNPKISYIFETTCVLSIICIKCENEDENIFKEEDLIATSKILGLIKNIQLL